MKTVRKYGAGNLGIAELMPQLEALLRSADIALGFLRKSAITEKIQNAVKERENIFRGLCDVVQGSRRYANVDRQDAAERLTIVLAGYRKSILKVSQAQGSGGLHNLLQDLHRAPCRADVALLELTGWVDELQAAENRFLALSEERYIESSNKPQVDIKKIRTRVDPLYTSAIAVVYARLLALGLGGKVVLPPGEGNIPYNFAADWNETVKKFRNMLAVRAGKRNKRKASEEEENESGLMYE